TRTTININTTSDKILMALVEGLAANDATELLAQREQQPFAKIQDFISHDILAGLKIHDKSLSISSSYFLFTSKVKIARVKKKLNSVLHRMDGEVKVIKRFF
ncbi:type II secretion system protein GspK, partial [Thiotrichales bacterium HSG1]|nr:type II secretion system protein GspK [Thiotrichales bacterium HSG1]